MKIRQDGIIEYTGKNLNIISTECNNSDIINFVKGFCNMILSIIDENSHIKDIQLFTNEVLKLKEMSLREDMNKYINLETRRKQVQKLLLLIESIKLDFGFEKYKELKKILKTISLENFARQILPNRSGIIRKSNHKTESYLNNHDMLGKKVLEPREYIGINPLAYSDLDSPSIVTALTPGKYTQPEHSHDNNYEITFYTGPSIAKYRDNGKLVTLKPNFGDFVIFPPKTIHTIHNPSDEAVMNISIKLPSALLDRGQKIDSRPGKGEIRPMVLSDIKGIYKSNLEKEKVPYYIKIFNFSEIENRKCNVQSEGKISAFYIIKGNFIGNFKGENIKYSLSQGDTIYLEPGNTINIEDLNGDGVIYGVYLK